MRHAAVVVGLGLFGWALCAATMGFGMALLGLQTALAVHALAAPVFFSAISFVYFKRLAYTTPIVTACAFLGVVIFMDVFVVAMLVQHSFAMFGSFVGTWLPFALIFSSTLLTGFYVVGRGPSRVEGG
jgi:hypothetical protein